MIAFSMSPPDSRDTIDYTMAEDALPLVETTRQMGNFPRVTVVINDHDGWGRWRDGRRQPDVVIVKS